VIRLWTFVLRCDMQPTSALLPREISLCVYADDTYIIIAAVYVHSRMVEIENIEVWACLNNHRLNRRKSVEIIFSNSGSRTRHVVSPSPVYCPTSPASVFVEDTLSYSLQSTVSRRPRAECRQFLSAQTLHALRLLRVYTACLTQRYRWSTELSSSPDCCTRLVGFH